MTYSVGVVMLSAILAGEALLGGETPADPSPSQEAIGFDGARHLLSRAGFGGTPEEISALAALPRDRAVASLIDGLRSVPTSDPPPWLDEQLRPPRQRDEMTDEERKELRLEQRRRARLLRSWWIDEMLATPSPLTERLVLFFHNHFTSALEKVKSPTLMYRQNQLFREHANGSFAELLRAIPRDGAMMLYLDSQTNESGKPNENFARELLELFTLGEGRYTERDVREAARAFTGWKVRPQTGEVRFAPRLHDSGEKSFLGRTGTLGPDQIIDALLEEPRLALHVTEKLWREFVSPTPDPSEVARIADLFRASEYGIPVLVRELLACPAFWDPAERGALVKSPVELIVGTLRLLELEPPESERLAFVSRQLGQDLFDPPTVKGWPGGTAWISANTLLLRDQFLERITGVAEMSPAPGEDGRRPNRPRRPREVREATLGAWFGSLPGSGEERLALATKLLLPIAPVRAPNPDAPADEIVLDLVLDPVYQLK